MNHMNRISRREFLRNAGLGSAFLFATLLSPRFLFPKPNPSGKLSNSPAFIPDLELELKATRGRFPLLPGPQTFLWTYSGEVLKGDPGALQVIENSYLGPIIRVRKGEKVRIYFKNKIDDVSIIHWHGLHVPQEMDGHPSYVIPQGKTYVYEFEVKNRAGTYWYHPHPHGRTGPQVYFGLAGLFLVSDDDEEAAALPSGEYDIPLVIQDRSFDNKNQLIYLPNGMMDQMTGFLGNEILVNGQRNYSLQVSTRAYRFRLLNGSNSRIYKLGWDDSEPITVIGTDGGLLERPGNLPYVMLGPGERIDLWVDFSRRTVGTTLTLRSLSFDGGIVGGMGGMMHGMGGMMGRRSRGRGLMGGNPLLPNGAEFRVLKVHVARKEKAEHTLTDQLSNIHYYRIQETVNKRNPRRFRFSMRMMNWTINNRVFEMRGVANDEIVRLNTMEVWEMINESGGMGMMGMMQMPHPIHIHGPQFQVVERSTENTQAGVWKGVREGFVDQGWKDTLLLMPGMRAKIVLRFEDYTGLFLYHCHNLEHEDMGMMRNYLIRA